MHISFQVHNREASYRVVIIAGSTEGTGIDIDTEDYCGDNCSYTFSLENPVPFLSVAVEVVGCITEKLECINRSRCKYQNRFVCIMV